MKKSNLAIYLKVIYQTESRNVDRALRKKYAKKILRKLTRQMREHLTPDSLVILRDEDFTHTSAIELQPGDIIICNLIPGLDSPPFIEVIENCLELCDQVKTFPAKPEPQNPIDETPTDT